MIFLAEIKSDKRKIENVAANMVYCEVLCFQSLKQQQLIIWPLPHSPFIP